MNLFAEFRRLLPQAPIIVATVQVEFADGTTSCQTVASELIRVLGTNNRAAGAKVLVHLSQSQPARILGDAPSLPTALIEV